MAKSLKNKSRNDKVLAVVIHKKPGEDLTQEDINQLKASSDQIQPEKMPPDSMDDLDIEVSDKINELYHWLCEKDVSFYIGALLPKSKENKAVYRICKLDTPQDGKNFNFAISKLGWMMYYFLDHSGILNWCESMGYITIHKSTVRK